MPLCVGAVNPAVLVEGGVALPPGRAVVGPQPGAAAAPVVDGAAAAGVGAAEVGALVRRHHAGVVRVRMAAVLEVGLQAAGAGGEGLEGEACGCGCQCMQSMPL